MDESVIITVGYPHELLGHLKRMDGAGDINFFADSERLIDEYKKKYSDYEPGVKELEAAIKLGIITEMIEIFGEPMWRKRSFINKSAIRLMQQPGFKEYEMVELLESFVQLFDWDIDMQLSRRWETTEEDSAQWYKENNSRTVKKSDERPEIPVQEKKDVMSVNSNEVTEEYESDNDIIAEFMDAAAGQLGTQINAVEAMSGESEVIARLKEKDNGRMKISKGRQSENTRHIYAEQHEVSRIDSMLGWMTIKEFVENEILKSGLKFEKLMSNSWKREARRAVNGNTDSQCKMGSYYAEPGTKHTDIVEAVKWYKLSASRGNNKAQFELGMLYDKGKIKCEDYKEKAMECYMALAEAGFPSAQCKVGLKYRFGDGVDENLEEAVKWFKKSANQGHVDAQRNLGDIYEAMGKISEAERWYGKAASAGDTHSEKKLNKLSKE